MLVRGDERCVWSHLLDNFCVMAGLVPAISLKSMGRV